MDTGLCGIQAPYFVANQTGFYQDAHTGICYFVSWDHFTNNSGLSSYPLGTPWYDTIYPLIQNTRPCGITAGRFVHNLGAYYSNGSSYCGYADMDHFKRCTGLTSFTGMRTYSIIPASMTYDGLCSCGDP